MTKKPLTLLREQFEKEKDPVKKQQIEGKIKKEVKDLIAKSIAENLEDTDGLIGS